ncbi:MAG: hypothetical protein FJY29_07770 [Betaproteobacteria bacterium]|nr:hypothetical protein [Betaproteobacteria bacterium]
MNYGFIQCALAALLVQIVTPQKALAEIVPTEDFELVSSNTEEPRDGTSDGNMHPEIAVAVGMGHVTLPYSPPGFGSYENNLRFTAFRFGVHRNFSSESLFTRSFYSLKLKNIFPAAGRSYDLQAVSWFDLAFEAGLEKQFSLAENTRLRWLGSAEALYERIHYPRGTLALYGVPLRAGTLIQQDTTVADSAVSFGLGADYAWLGFGKTAVKHDAFPVSRSATANRVKFQPDRSVTGQMISAAFSVDFSSVQWRDAQGGNAPHKHQLSFTWESKSRHADAIAAEYTSTGEVLDAVDLELQQTSFGLRWSERL